MVRPSNPKLMAKVLEAVTNLGENKGSLTRDILKFVKQNSAGSPRNLTMQVQRALKHAVNAGVLGCKSGRYKIQLELNKVSHRHRYEEAADYKNPDVGHEMRDESPAGGIELSRKIQDRQKSSRMKRPVQKGRKRSRARGTKKKLSRRRGAMMAKRSRKMAKNSRRKTNNSDEKSETWASRKRRMMAKPKYEDDDDDDDEDNDNEDDEEEREEEHIREPRRMPKMKSVNEDMYSDISGDSVAVGRHRSRRSKHLAKERRSPSRRGDGDGESHRKPSRRSRSRRRRSQPRQRENRQVPTADEPTEDQAQEANEERNNELMEMDDDQADVERQGTPPENQGNE